MIKRLVIYSVLLSMTLHCACRLGVLDQVYQKRHSIAYTFGLISEIPIALCSSDYDFDQRLKIEMPRENAHTGPQTIVNAKEIHLFFVSIDQLICNQSLFLSQAQLVSYTNHYVLIPEVSIFHPPSF